MSKVPKIRFRKFTDEWDQRKLAAYLDVSTEKNIDDIYTRNDVLSVSGDYGIVNQIEFKGRSFAGASVSNYGVVHTGDVVYTKSPLNSNPYGIMKTNKGKAGIVSTLYAVYKTKEETFPEFVQTYFENNARMNKYMRPLVNKGAKNDMKVSSEDALKGEVTFPKHNEQVAIYRFFEELDSLIFTHQRKYEQMINVKESILEKLYPHIGASFPEIQFKEFTADWKRKKLGDVFEEYCEKHHEELPPLTIIQGKGTILRDESNRNLQYDKSTLHNYKMVRKGDFIVHLRSFEGGFEKATSDGIISPAYYAFHGEEADTRFYYPYFRSNEFINVELSRHVYGIRDGRSIDISGMKTIMIPYTSIEEQRKIGDFLEGLDTLIELYQQKFVKLKQIKSACLDGMFI